MDYGQQNNGSLPASYILFISSCMNNGDWDVSLFGSSSSNSRNSRLGITHVTNDCVASVINELFFRTGSCLTYHSLPVSHSPLIKQIMNHVLEVVEQEETWRGSEGSDGSS